MIFNLVLLLFRLQRPNLNLLGPNPLPELQLRQVPIQESAFSPPSISDLLHLFSMRGPFKVDLCMYVL